MEHHPETDPLTVVILPVALMTVGVAVYDEGAGARSVVGEVE